MLYWNQMMNWRIYVRGYSYGILSSSHTDGSYFSAETPTEGRVWTKRVNRIILPAKELEVTEDKAKAVVLTVDMGNHYSPSCELKIVSEPVNYSLPINTMLSFKGIVKEPLEVNIKASKWTDENNKCR